MLLLTLLLCYLTTQVQLKICTFEIKLMGKF